jgi:predicted Zn finger-like uncharacterized protein
MKIVCDSCGTKYSISDDKVRGKVFKIRCKKCSHIIVVRGTSDAAAAAPAAVEGGWHLVVDGEQVGPVPESEIRGKLERGEVNGETYVWKEGFADWMKLSAVPEFADLTGSGESGGMFTGDPAAPAAVNGADGSGRARAERSGGLFAGVSNGAAAESDVFAAPAPATARAGGGDLFASPAARPAADEPRWPAQGSAAGHDGGRIESLTGQRHENSVLFSLSNLQSLAMPSAAKPAPATTTAPTSEGSGLIDIRAMAATTLGAPADSGRGGLGGSDDLPAFGAFSPAAPVLLPLPGSSGAPRWVYPLIGVAALLFLVVIFMAYKVITAKPPTVVTEVAPPPPAEVAKPSAPLAEKGPAPAAAAAPTEKKPSTIPEGELPPREAAKAEGKSEGKSEKAERKHGKGRDRAEKKSGGDEKKAAGGAAAVAAAEPSPTMEKRPARGSLDDLLEGALNKRSGGPSKPREEDTPRKAEAASAGPLSKSAVVSGMNGVKPKVSECYAQYKVPGMAMVNVVIGKNGKVSSATVTGKFAGTPTGTCVEKAVKSASFPPSDGLSTPYPFQLK